MPYDRFLRACEATGYDVELLQRRFGAGFEQIAHRLTTLHRVGARGLPFFMIRIDRAGQASKRYAGASGSALVEADGRCPLWDLHAAFDRPGGLVRQIVELEDATRWFIQARTVSPAGGRIGQVRAQFVVGLGLDAKLAAPLAAARGFDLARGEAVPIGLGCRQCTRPDCPQRAAPPAARSLVFNERERGVSPFVFTGD
jgi:XRE family transcriptional regulator, fatty acid utilization regulator